MKIELLLKRGNSLCLIESNSYGEPIISPAIAPIIPFNLSPILTHDILFNIFDLYKYLKDFYLILYFKSIVYIKFLTNLL